MSKALIHPVTSLIMMTPFHLSAAKFINFTLYVKIIYMHINIESTISN